VFHIKICGITNVEDARTAAEAGADAVGLNFYPASPRYVSPETARRIAQSLPKGIVRAGVFVNAAVEEMCRLFEQVPLDVIQLHGDEPPEMIRQLGGRPAIKAFHLKSNSLQPVREYLERCRELAAMPRMVLLDSQTADLYGGTGKTCDWSTARQYIHEIQSPPLILAGGLRAENVAEAIRAVRPAAVDTASGVESGPGRKDPALVAAFVQAAKTAWKNSSFSGECP
jgi:phosphoribosylanthranilate isomerase